MKRKIVIMLVALILVLVSCKPAALSPLEISPTNGHQTIVTNSVTTSSTTSVLTLTPSQTSGPTSTTTVVQTTTPTITSTPGSPTTQPPTTSITAFNFSSVLFGRSSSLGASVQTIDRTLGNVVVNGGDTRQPTIPFTFDWGDGKVTNTFFPGTHTYSDTNKNYVITVTAHYSDGTTDSVQFAALFNTPTIKPISLPDDIKVTIPSSPVLLESRMPGYKPSSNLTVFNDSCFTIIPRSTVEYILTVAASIQKDFANDDVYLVNGGFNQVVLSDPNFGGMYSLWFTSPVSFGAGNYAFQGTPQWSSFFHEMGHNITLNSPANYYFGGKIDGSANAIFSESMAQIFQHATALYLINNYQTYGLSEDLVLEIKDSALSSMQLVKNSYESYLSNGKHFSSWNDPSTSQDDTFGTFVTIAYKFFEHAEKSPLGYQTSLKRMMRLLQLFDENMAAKYDPKSNTETGAAFRSTLMVTALSYAFEQDLRPEFRDLNFPIDDQVYDELFQKASFLPPQ